MNATLFALTNGNYLSHPYILLTATSIALILGYFFKRLPQRTYWPSVILLTLTGILIRFGFDLLAVDMDAVMPFFDIVCGIALIVVVLEASMGLQLKKRLYNQIGHSMLISMISLALTTLAIASILNWQLNIGFEVSLLFAVPLSVLSSSIVIPSVNRFPEAKKEFLIYESSVSDIIGIIVFYFLISHLETGGLFTSIRFFFSLILTILAAVVATAILINLFKKLNSQIKFLLLISNLVLLYSLANLFNLSLLLIVMIFSAVFGLILANQQKFRKLFKRFEIGTGSQERTEKEFHLITLESAYLFRVFFFVLFGMTIDVANLLNLEIVLISLVIVGVIYILRVILLYYFSRPNLLPEMYLAPRGLVTIILFFQIPDQFLASDLKPGILFYVIIFTNIIMTFYLNRNTMYRSLPNEDKIPKQAISD